MYDNQTCPRCGAIPYVPVWSLPSKRRTGYMCGHAEQKQDRRVCGINDCRCEHPDAVLRRQSMLERLAEHDERLGRPE